MAMTASTARKVEVQMIAAVLLAMVGMKDYGAGVEFVSGLFVATCNEQSRVSVSQSFQL